MYRFFLPMLIMMTPLTQLSAGENFAWFKKHLARHQVRTLEEAIAKLPKRYRRNFSLVYASRATATSTWHSPRAILFGDSAELVIAFNPSQNTLEIMDFDPREEQFKFHEVIFSKTPGRPRISENDQSCLGCHRGGTPLWDSGPIKPGVFGSSASATQERLGAQLREFARSANSHPLYGQMEFPRTEDGLSFHFKAKNEKLSRLLGALNVKRMIRVLREKSPEEFHRITPLLMARSLNCSDLEKFIPGERRGPYIQELRKHFTEVIVPRLVNHRQRSALEGALLGEPYAPMDTEAEEQQLRSQLRQYLSEVLLDKLAPYHFRLTHTNISPEDFFFHDGEYGLERVGLVLASASMSLQLLPPALKCEKLRQMSLEAFNRP